MPLATYYGEYHSVARRIHNKELLEIAHLTRVGSMREAERILKELSAEYLGNSRRLKILWGKSTRYAYGGLLSDGQPYIELSSRHLATKFKLRVGLLLHEMAHILTDLQGLSNSSHGKAFVASFDRLLVDYYSRF